MSLSNSSLQRQPTLYLFRADDLPLQNTPTPDNRKRLQHCLTVLRTALLASSKAHAIYHLNRASEIAHKLETKVTHSSSPGTNRVTSWCLSDQENYLDIQAIYIDYPLQYLVLNLVSAYGALLRSTTDTHFTAPTTQTQRYGLLNCIHFLDRVLDSSVEVS